MDAYAKVWELPLTEGAGEFAIRETLHHWINDGLMGCSFSLVGLEIKREVLVGELASVPVRRSRWQLRSAE